MKILKYRKTNASYSPWSQRYCDVAQAVIDFIRSDIFEVIHIGSTSFKVGGKGIIDLTVLYENNQLDLATKHLFELGFQDQISIKPFPVDRPRKDGTVNVNGQEYYLHVHVIANGSEEHIKQIKYKNYMLNNSKARKEYELYKKNILTKGFIDQEIYGEKKSPFVKYILKSID